MKPILLYGAGDMAEYVRYLIEQALQGKAAAYVVDKEYLPSEPMHNGLPIVDTDHVLELYPPERYDVVIAFLEKMGDDARERAFRKCCGWGYGLPNIIHPSAVNDCSKLGQGNIIAAGTLLAPGATVGDGNIFFETSAISHHSEMGSFNTLEENFTIGGASKIGDHCHFGTGCVVESGVCIANYCYVMAGAHIKDDLEPYDLVESRPSRVVPKAAKVLIKTIGNAGLVNRKD